VYFILLLNFKIKKKKNFFYLILDFSFFVQAFDNITTKIKEMWGPYYNQIVNNECYIIHPQLIYKHSHRDLYHIFVDKRGKRKMLSFRSFINILFGEEIIKHYRSKLYIIYQYIYSYNYFLIEKLIKIFYFYINKQQRVHLMR